jgi:hypothetical protein
MRNSPRSHLLDDEEIRRGNEQFHLKRTDLDKKLAEVRALQKDIKWQKQGLSRLTRDTK